jgi:hypothetical protein
MPGAFIQRIGIRKRKLTTTRSTLMRHGLSYGCQLISSNAEVTAEIRGAVAAATWCSLPRRRRAKERSRRDQYL